jgi:hypothetical protein
MVGNRVAAMALRESGRLDEADAVLREAASRFPDAAWLAAERDEVARVVGCRQCRRVRSSAARSPCPKRRLIWSGADALGIEGGFGST